MPTRRPRSAGAPTQPAAVFANPDCGESFYTPGTSSSSSQDWFYAERISQRKYDHQRAVFTSRAVDKLRGSEAFQKFTSDPTKKEVEEPYSTQVQAWGRRIGITAMACLAFLGAIQAALAVSAGRGRLGRLASLCTSQLDFILSNSVGIVTDQMTTKGRQLHQKPNLEPFGFNEDKKMRLWAKPMTKEVMAGESTLVRVPNVKMSVRAMPVTEKCSANSISEVWTQTVEGQTMLAIPVGHVAGSFRLCLKYDDGSIVDQRKKSFTVCGITRVNTPVPPSAGKDFTLDVTGYCMAAKPVLSILPPGESHCENGRKLQGIRTSATEANFLVHETKGAAANVCVLLSKGWFQLPRLIVHGASDYHVTDAKANSFFRNKVLISVNGIDMKPEPQLQLADFNTTCADFNEDLTGIEPSMYSPYHLSFDVDLRRYRMQLRGNVTRRHMEAPATRLFKVCLGWDGDFIQVGEPFEIKNDVNTPFSYMLLMSVVAVCIVYWRYAGGGISRGGPNLCSICWHKSCTVAFNCGHVCTCNDCHANVSLCPICRTAITKRLPVYFP